MESLEERISRLESIEAIRYLQAKYQRCLDTRDFDGLDACFDDNVVSAYDNGKISYKGKAEVLGFLKKVMTEHMPSTHLIHGGEIDIISPTSAKAKWYLEDFLLHRIFWVKLHGAAIYDVEYVKDDSSWKIKTIGYTRCYQYFEHRGLLNLLTLGKTSFLDAYKKLKKHNQDSI
mgnify:CR=1 FL=1